MARAVLVIVLMNLLSGCMAASAEAKQDRQDLYPADAQ